MNLNNNNNNNSSGSPSRFVIDGRYERRLHSPSRTPVSSPLRNSNKNSIYHSPITSPNLLKAPSPGFSPNRKRNTPHSRSKSDTTELYREFKRPSPMNSPYRYNDRFIPSRITSNFDNIIPSPASKQRYNSNNSSNSNGNNTDNHSHDSDNIRDSSSNSVNNHNNNSEITVNSEEKSAYNLMLRNELLSSPHNENRGNSPSSHSPARSNRTFRFTSPSHILKSKSPTNYGILHGEDMQRIINSPHRSTRKISKAPYKVLDAPNLKDDFYLNLVDWSSQNTLAVGLGSSVYLWSPTTGSVEQICDLSSENNDCVASISWSKKGTYLAIGTRAGKVHIMDGVKCKRVRTMSGHNMRVGAMSWNRQLLATGSRDRSVLLRDPRSQESYLCKKEHMQEVCGLKWSPDNINLASGGNDNKLLIWDVPNTTPLHSFSEHTAAVKALAWSPHQHGVLASGGGTADRCIKFWNTLTGTRLSSIDTGSQVCNLLWSKNVNELVSTHGYSLNQIIVWKYPSLQKLATLTGHTYRVLYLAASPDGQTVVTGAGDDTLRFWNVFPHSKAFLNAIIERRIDLLHQVGCIRLCSQSSLALPPFSDMPNDLCKIIYGDVRLVDGGYEYNGEAMNEINEEELINIANEWLDNDIWNIVISGVFSPTKPLQELQVESIIRKVYESKSKPVNITLSHKLGNLGLLERENASILNACLIPYATHTIEQMYNAVKSELKLNCPIFLTSNYGTILNADIAKQFPINTFACGSTNSMRGAMLLCSGLNNNMKDAIVADIGGTTTDIGLLKNGAPLLSQTTVEVEKGIRTNFRMPNVVSIGLGGGSIIELDDDNNNCVSIGPKSVGSNLTKEAKCFGGNKLVMTDIIITKGDMKPFDNSQPLKNINESMINNILNHAMKMIDDCVDLVKIDSNSLPLIICGGGAIMVPDNIQFKGIDKVIKPLHADVANAVGAAIAQVSYQIDKLVEIKDNRDEILDSYKQEAINQLKKMGAQPDTIEILEINEVPLAYVKTPMVRITIRVVGDLDPYNLNLSNEILTDQSSTQFKKNEHTSKFLPSLIENPNSAVNNNNNNVDNGKVWNVTCKDIDWIADGAAILGAGGGGSPYIAANVAKMFLKQGKTMQVVNYKDINDDEYFVPIAFMGAPVVLIEKLMTGTECLKSFEAIKKIEKNKIKGLVAAEIGGFNAITPLIVAALLSDDMVVVDCDGMGRAFPELQHYHPFIVGSNTTPAALSDEKGNSVIISGVQTPKWMEKILRNVVVQFGAAAALTFPPLNKEDIETTMIKNTISLSRDIGFALHEANKNKTDVFEAIIQAYGGNGKCILKGKISDVSRTTDGGFNKGTIKIKPFEMNNDDVKSELIVHFQNENLIAYQDNNVLACVPDIITICDAENGSAITTESLRYGLRVAVLVLEAPKQLQTVNALKVVGPESFGYSDVKYKNQFE